MDSIATIRYEAATMKSFLGATLRPHVTRIIDT